MSERKFYSQAEKKIIYQRIRDEIPIQDYAASRGFQLIKKGIYFQIAGQKGVDDFSSVMINTRTNRYARYSRDKKQKSIIDFVMELDNCDEKTAISKLFPLIDTYDLAQSKIYKPKKEHIQKELILPNRTDTTKNVYAYLYKTRFINKDVIDYFLWNGWLYQENKYNNCVFVNFDRQDNPRFCCKRGSTKHSKFKQDVPGSSYKYCFFIDHGADTLIVNEGIIDTMSVMSIMLDKGKKINSFSYVSLSGVAKWEAVGNILQDNPCITKVILACDNDEGGFNAMENIKNDIALHHPQISVHYLLPDNQNDWNSQLKYIRQNNITVDQYFKTNNAVLPLFVQIGEAI